jgi:acetoin utilization protein AcuB
MLVKDWMSKDVITIDVNDCIEDAVNLLLENDNRALPVMDNNKLVGIVSDRDLKMASVSDTTSLDAHAFVHLTSKIKVKFIMTKNPITIPFDFTVEETASVLLKHKISGAPVVNQEGKIVGIITQADLFRLIISLTGVEKEGLQFGFQVEDRPGSIKELDDIIRHFGGRIVSILTSYENVPAGYRKVYIRLTGKYRDRLPELKAALKEKATLLYMVNHCENIREIY